LILAIIYRDIIYALYPSSTPSKQQQSLGILRNQTAMCKVHNVVLLFPLLPWIRISLHNAHNYSWGVLILKIKITPAAESPFFNFIERSFLFFLLHEPDLTFFFINFFMIFVYAFFFMPFFHAQCTCEGIHPLLPRTKVQGRHFKTVLILITYHKTIFINDVDCCTGEEEVDPFTCTLGMKKNGMKKNCQLDLCVILLNWWHIVICQV